MGPIITSLQPHIEEWIKDLRLKHRRSPRTLESYAAVLKRFHDFLGEQTLTPASLQDFIQDSSSQLAPSSLAQWTSALKNFFTWAEKQKQFGPEFKKIIQRPRLTKKLTQIVEEEDLHLLKQMIETRPQEEQLFFELIYGSGLRLSEAYTFEFSKADLSTPKLQVLGKGNKYRQVPLTSKAVSLLKTIGKNPWIGRTTVRSLRRWVENWGKLCALEENCGPLHPHKLRHSIASHLLKRGAKLPQIQKLLGHERLGTTERYTHLNVDDLVRVYDESFPKVLTKKS